MADDYAHKMIQGSKGRNDISRKITESVDAIIRDEETRRRLREKNGSMNQDILNSGTIKRVFGIDLVDSESLNKDDKTTYNKGYYEIGKTQIQIMSDTLKPTDNVMRLYKKLSDNDKKNINLEDMGIEFLLYEIGKRDYQNGLAAAVEYGYYYEGYSKKKVK